MFENLIARRNELAERRENGDEGFTLIELLVVVVIIGILIAIAIPLYLNYQKGAKDKSAASDLKSAVNAVNQCYGQFSNVYPDTGTQSAAGGEMTFSLSGTDCSTKAQSSDGTTLVYSPQTKGFQITATNADGSGKVYTYNSTTSGGGVIK